MTPANRPPRGRLALAGAVAGGAGIAASHLLAAVLHQPANPVQLVAEQVIRITPGRLVEALVHLVGRNDKPFLVAGIAVTIVVLGAVAGLLTLRGRWWGQLVFWAMAAVALVLSMQRPSFTPYTVLPLAAGVLVWVIGLDFLTSVARPRPTVPESRRRFLLGTGAVAVAALAAVAGERLLGHSRMAVETTRRLLRLPVTDGVVPDEAQAGPTGVSAWRTPSGRFYRIDTVIVTPVVDPADWTLRIHGMVDHEITISYADLLQRTISEAWITLCCVSNEVGGDLIGNAWWSGVRIADLLREAGVSEDADAVKQTSADGWTCGTPLEALTDDRDALLAVAMNGRPLPVEHGFPVRMVVPGLYGYVSATKWLVDLEVTRFDRFSAFWTDNGWSEKGPVKTESRIEVPRDGASLKTGKVRIGGHAWAQHTGIRGVEFRIDGRGWQPAELGRVPGRDTWVQWSGSVEVDDGDHTLAVRATDRSGYTQTAARADVVPDGATGWHTVSFSVG